MTATILALSLWLPAPWAVPTRVIQHGTVAHFNQRTEAYMIHGRKVAEMVPSRCRAGYAIRNLTRTRLIVRYIPA